MALNELLRRTDAVEQKWLIRMILKDLKFGMSEDTILNVFHPDARDLYDVTSSISTVSSGGSNDRIGTMFSRLVAASCV